MAKIQTNNLINLKVNCWYEKSSWNLLNQKTVYKIHTKTFILKQEQTQQRDDPKANPLLSQSW